MSVKVDLASVIWQLQKSNLGGSLVCLIEFWDDRDAEQEFPVGTFLNVSVDAQKSVIKPVVKVRKRHGKTFMVDEDHLWEELEVKDCFGSAIRSWLEANAVEGIEPQISYLNLRYFDQE